LCSYSSRSFEDPSCLFTLIRFFSSDFFDAKVPVIADEVIALTVTEKLPEGFFDDPKMDAKVCISFVMSR